MGIAPLAFTGISSFSDDLQTILKRSVQIASLPVQHLQGDQARLLARRSSYLELRSAVADLASSLAGLADLGEGKSIAASSSSSAVSASIQGTAAPGTYLITDIVSLAKQAVATSAQGFADTDTTELGGAANVLYLMVGGQTTEISLTDETDNLAGVRDAINSAGAGVTASIIDTGDAENPYYLTLTAVDTGQKTVELRTAAEDPGSNILELTSPGADAVFTINGQTVTKPSNVVEGVIPGVKLELNGVTGAGEEVTIQVASSVTAVTGALGNFVRAYNTLTQSLDSQVGRQGGPLTGDSLVREVSQLLRQVTGHRMEGLVASLADLGISLAKDGTMSLDTSVIPALPGAALNGLFSFLGSSTTGLGAFASRFSDYSEEVSGLIQAQIENIDEADARISEQVAALTGRISAMQSTLMAKLQAADTLLARLEGQRGLLDAVIESLNTVSFGKRSED